MAGSTCTRSISLCEIRREQLARRSVNSQFDRAQNDGIRAKGREVRRTSEGRVRASGDYSRFSIFSIARLSFDTLRPAAAYPRLGCRAVRCSRELNYWHQLRAFASQTDSRSLLSFQRSHRLHITTKSTAPRKTCKWRGRPWPEELRRHVRRASAKVVRDVWQPNQALPTCTK